MYRKRRAFSLIEMAMVVAISGLMLNFALKANQSNAKDCYAETRTQIQTIRSAVEAYAQKNDRLPLPALMTLGVEDPLYGHEGLAASQTSAPTGTPTSYWGQVPFQALGLSPSYGADCWGNKIVYVTSIPLTTPVGYLDPAAVGVITLNSAAATTINTNTAYAIISYGQDATGMGGVKANATSAAWCTGGATLKYLNCLANASTVADAVFNDGKDAAANYFDDVVITGGRHMMAPAGIYGWGQNYFGEIGDGTTTQRNLPTSVTGSSTFVKVFTGQNNACALDITGKAYCWGYGFAGENGDGTTTNRYSPVAVAGGHNFTKLSVGAASVCGIDIAKQLWCWGYNVDGRLGDGTMTNRTVPTAVVGGTNIVSIELSAGWPACAINTTGTLYCWGRNQNGQIGDGTTTDRNVPTAVSGTYALVRILNTGTCALDTTGKAWCWGSGNSQIGDGTSSDRASPTAVATSVKFQDMVVGYAEVCALSIDNIAYCWGEDDYYNRQYSPVAVSAVKFKQLYAQPSAPYTVACGLTMTNDAYCWGSNYAGSVGDGTTTNHYFSATPVSGGHKFSQLYISGYTACGLTDTGQAYCWGDNYNGKIGDTTTTDRYVPTLVSGGKKWAALYMGGNDAYGLIGNPLTSFCRGPNNYGQIGDGTTTDRADMTAVTITPEMKANQDSYFKNLTSSQFACGIGNSSGKAYCWGYSQGTAQKTPLWISAFGPTVTFASLSVFSVGCCAMAGVTTNGHSVYWADASTSWSQDRGDNGGTPWVQIATGHVWYGQTLLDASGHITYFDGYNYYPEPPTATMVSAGVTKFTKIAAGAWHTCALADNGTLWCWDSDAEQQLGDGGSGGSSQPYTTSVKVPFPAGVTAWTDVAGNGSHSNEYGNTCAIGNDGKVYCWGSSAQGSLGNGTGLCVADSYQAAPTVVIMPQGVISFTQLTTVNDGYAGLSYCAIGSNHQLYCWGYASYSGNGCTSSADRPFLEPLPIGGGFTGYTGPAAGAGKICATAYH